MKAGKEYELLIEQMYRKLEPNAKVTFDDYIYDSRAQIDRQIDVSIRYKFAGVDHLIIIQAKDHKRKADIAVVDQFQKVIEDTNANKGILICASGFTKSAINKAISYGIECLSVHSALNKKWETLVKIPVNQIVHEFKLESQSNIYMAHKAGKEVTLISDTFSYDGLNIIGIADIIMEHIIKKNSWEFIKKGKIIRLELKNLDLYHSFDDEMLPVHSGFIDIRYIKSSTKKFYIEPSNYVYESNYTSSTNNLRDLTISLQTLEKIQYNNFLNDPTVIDQPIISTTLFKFNDNLFHMNFSFSINGNIEGNLIIDGDKIIRNDERGQAISKLQEYLKKNKAV